MKKFIGIIIVMLFIGSAITVNSSLGERENSLDKPIILPGNHLKFMSFDEETRSYRVHIPPSYDGSNPVPIVFAFHGNPGVSLTWMFNSGLNEISDEEGFIAVYPNGHLDMDYAMYWMNERGLIKCLINGFRYWNWGDFVNTDDDDVGFIRALIEELTTTLNIDSSRIYATGMSAGGFMSHRLGSELSDIIAAIAPCAGSIGGKSWVDFTIDPNDVPDIPSFIITDPENPVSVIIFHGMDDQNVPYDGIEDEGWFFYLSVNESVSFWVEHNECDPIPDIEISDSGNIITSTYSNGNQGTDVVLYSVVNGGHNWFGGVFGPESEISAAELAWEFFEAHPKQ